MPKIWPILAQGFTNVFTRLGIQAVPAGQQWFLSDTLIPVSLVDTDVTLAATITPAAQIFSSEGRKVAPVAGLLLATTGALIAGLYQFVVHVSCFETGGNTQFAIQHRDAADAANIFQGEIMFSGAVMGGVNETVTWTKQLALNERLRVITPGGGTALMEYFAWIQHTRLSD